MSQVDLFKHKPLARLLDHALYLAEEDFSEYLGYSVKKNDLIWRDDSNRTPVIINLRCCIHQALDDAMWDSYVKDSTNENPFKREVGEPGTKELKDAPESWQEFINYQNISEDWNNYVSLVGKEDAGCLQYWVFGQIGLLIIKFYPELLTEKEKLEANEFHLMEPVEFPLGMEPYVL